MKSFEEIRVVVTGGASGIGAAVTSHLREQGADVVVLDRAPRDADPTRFVLADVSVADQVPVAINEAARMMGGIDVLVNNAGIGAIGDVTEATENEWTNLWSVNVVGLARTTKAALPYLKASSNAAIVNTASIVAAIGVPKRAVYAATKGAVVSLTYAMAADFAEFGIRVNAVAPGTADTPWVGRLLDAASNPRAERSALEARQPSGRLIRADEVALAIAYLAHPSSTSTNGTVLFVDGGMERLRIPPKA
jgi:NAD(P)-dependent dehydrogenase (short-subunit alcohol dehydrogenase family)